MNETFDISLTSLSGSFETWSKRWSIHIMNPVNKTKLSVLINEWHNVLKDQV